MRKITIAAFAALLLSGCAHDPYGNEVWQGRHAEGFTFQHVEMYKTNDVIGWCNAHNGTLTADTAACVWTWKAIRTNSLPCIYAMRPDLSGDRLAADKTFLDAVCNGFNPA
ncbi:MAG: lipoprotein [Terriglobia bacterium]|nr:lipoprotein [Terriglobia bacterium]